MKSTLKIVENRHEVFVNGKRVHLSPKEFEILIVLKKCGVTISREVLIDRLWTTHEGKAVYARTVDQHIARLRRKVGGSVVETVARYGYRIAAGA